MALPGRTDDGQAAFPRCLAGVVDAIGLDVVPEPDRGDQRRWDRLVRAALRGACRQGLTLREAAFGVLIKAAVRGPNPSFNRHFAEPVLNAF